MSEPTAPLSWVQPQDLLAHELVASAAEGKQVDDVRRRWQDAGGVAEPPWTGVGQEADDKLRRLAEDLLDELDARAPDAGLAEREPDELDRIEALCRHPVGVTPPGADLDRRIHGGWLGRASGCLLGKPVEKIPRTGIREILTSQGRWPLADWFTAAGLPDEVAERWPWNRRSRATSLREVIDGMPEDDDLNFAMLALAMLEEHGRALTTEDVAQAWLDSLPAGRVFTAERAAYRNLLLGGSAPRTATWRNPYREWIGAAIRTDVYGWASPGDPVAAARLAWVDARLSHVRSGIYGAIAVAAMCATAVVVDPSDPEAAVGAVLDAGLAVVPPASRYAEALRLGIETGRSGVGPDAGLDVLHEEYGDLHWVHMLNNAALTGYALTAGRGDFARSICLAVMGGWDTDSVGATVGSLVGAIHGVDGLPDHWTAPLRNRIASSLPGFDGIGFDELARRTSAVVVA